MSGDGLTPEQRDLSSTWGPHKAGSVDADTPGGRLVRTTVLPGLGAPGVGGGHEQTRPWHPQRECGSCTSVWTPAPRHARHRVRAHPSVHLKALRPSRTTSTLLGEPGLQRRLPSGLPGPRADGSVNIRGGPGAGGLLPGPGPALHGALLGWSLGAQLRGRGSRHWARLLPAAPPSTTGAPPPLLM